MLLGVWPIGRWWAIALRTAFSVLENSFFSTHDFYFFFFFPKTLPHPTGASSLTVAEWKAKWCLATCLDKPQFLSMHQKNIENIETCLQTLLKHLMETVSIIWKNILVMVWPILYYLKVFFQKLLPRYWFPYYIIGKEIWHHNHFFFSIS